MSNKRKELEDIKFDYKGHFHGYEHFVAKRLLPLYNLDLLTKGDFPHESMADFSGEGCSHCGKTIYFKFNFSENSITAMDKCDYPEGFPPYEFQIDIPSGKMVVANDLRNFFPIKDDFYVNFRIECARTSWAYARVGLAHGFVGNTCPGVYRVGQDEYVISSGGSISKSFDDIDEEYEYFQKYCLMSDSQRVADICTDLWWFSICDFDKLKENGCDVESEDCDIVEVTPGRYKFYHQYEHVRDKVFDAPEIYTKISLVKKF